MTKYLIRIPYDRAVHDHWQAQAAHMAKLYAAGVGHHMYQWISGTSDGRSDYHSWKITCNEEQLTYLSVSCNAEVLFNLTDQARRSGLAKLNQDELEALGLNG